MALTPEQQAEVELSEAREAGRRAHELALEQLRHQNNLAFAQAQASVDAKRAKLEAVRLAKETLIENSRSKPVDARDVTAADIAAFAAALESHINA